MTTTFVLIPAEDYRNLRDDLARIRQLLEALAEAATGKTGEK